MFGVISDTHLHNWSAFSTTTDGVNSRLSVILDEIDRAVKKTKAMGGKTVYHGGDLFHVRGSLPPSVLNVVIDRFKEITESMKICVMAGNHDLESNDATAVGNAAYALSQLPNVNIVSSPTYFSDDNVVMIPWRDRLSDVKADAESMKSLIGDPKECVCVIHAPVNEVIYGIPDHGFDAKELESLGYGLVLAGHYHNHKKLSDSVFSIGATTHQTWGDIGSLAGFLTVSSLKVTHHKTQAPLFVELNEDMSNIEGNYVRALVDGDSSSEMGAIRQTLMCEYGAKGVTFKVAPKKAVITRDGVTAKTGETLLGSIGAWIDNNKVSVSKEDLLAECELVIGQVEVSGE